MKVYNLGDRRHLKWRMKLTRRFSWANEFTEKGPTCAQRERRLTVNEDDKMKAKWKESKRGT